MTQETGWNERGLEEAQVLRQLVHLLPGGFHVLRVGAVHVDAQLVKLRAQELLSLAAPVAGAAAHVDVRRDPVPLLQVARLLPDLGDGA